MRDDKGYWNQIEVYIREIPFVFSGVLNPFFSTLFLLSTLQPIIFEFYCYVGLQIRVKLLTETQFEIIFELEGRSGQILPGALKSLNFEWFFLDGGF